jgi:hypothetical protein
LVDKEKKESIAKKVEHGTVSENDANKIAAQIVAHGGSAGVVPTTPPTSAKSVVNNAKSQAASIAPPDPNKPNFDLQLFAGAAGNSSLKHTLKAMQGFTGKRVSANGSPEYDEKKASEKTTSYQDDVTKYLKIISSNVDGQLNGIGSNVYKTRLAVQEIAGVNDKDVTGSANKDRVSLLGGFRRNMMMMLRHPVEFFGKMITAPFRAIAAVGTKIKNTVLGIATGINNVVKGAVHGAYEMVKGVGKALLAIPETLASLITGVVEVGKDLVVGALHVVTEGLVGVTSAFFGLVSHSISAIGNILNGLTKGVGALMEGVGLFGKALFEGFGEGLSLAAKTAINIAGGVADVTVGLVHTAGDMATAAMKGIGQVATSVVNGVMDVLG